MSDDLIKDEAEFIRNCATDIETGEPLDDDQLCNLYVIDAHRIADLIDAVEARIEELERERDDAQINHAAWKLEAEATQANLAKAMDIIKRILNAAPDAEDHTGWAQLLDDSAAVLAELEAKDE
jgi:hypothetical protein